MRRRALWMAVVPVPSGTVELFAHSSYSLPPGLLPSPFPFPFSLFGSVGRGLRVEQGAGGMRGGQRAFQRRTLSTLHPPPVQFGAYVCTCGRRLWRTLSASVCAPGAGRGATGGGVLGAGAGQHAGQRIRRKKGIDSSSIGGDDGACLCLCRVCMYALRIPIPDLLDLHLLCVQYPEPIVASWTAPVPVHASSGSSRGDQMGERTKREGERMLLQTEDSVWTLLSGPWPPPVVRPTTAEGSNERRGFSAPSLRTAWSLGAAVGERHREKERERDVEAVSGPQCAWKIKISPFPGPVAPTRTDIFISDLTDSPPGGPEEDKGARRTRHQRY